MNIKTTRYTLSWKLTVSLLPLFQIIPQNRNRGNIFYSFYEDTIAPISKPHEDATKKENYRPVSIININAKVLNRILQTEYKTHHK